ncbi:BlaI/MecI/CopY family transcriptional regulator [Streptomyces sp. SAI-090]|jgi:predicted transcriptional regulator|uniref:BlaI/MecI/CopY family transcriptional regulator n=1 Tax=Streptomyces sp. SAI-090 TaxID=2940545 RepID=UPI002476E065|nr:BlaI/MecI/CopY family transcriptional regulator [Streptomyces sp. SAI-090]
MRGLGELEAEIMSVMWRSAGPLAVRDLTEELNATRPLAYTTVMTVTERLRQKGWLDRGKQGRAYLYSAARSADDYTADLMGQALDASRDRGSALARFAGRLDAGDVATLREALERLPEESPSAHEG